MCHHLTCQKIPCLLYKPESPLHSSDSDSDCAAIRSSASATSSLLVLDWYKCSYADVEVTLFSFRGRTVGLRGSYRASQKKEKVVEVVFA